MEETPPRFCQWPFHPVVDPGFRLRGRNFKHAPRIVFSRPSQLKLIFHPIHSRMYQRMHMMVEVDGGDMERGIDFSQVSMYCFNRGI